MQTHPYRLNLDRTGIPARIENIRVASPTTHLGSRWGAAITPLAGFHPCDCCGGTAPDVDLWAENTETGEEIWLCLACGAW